MTQTQSGIEELVREGGAALRSGERERARALLAQAVRLNPRSEQAWLLLAGAVTDAEQRRSCLERVLRLNPEHTIARKAMATRQTGGDRRPTAGGQPPANPAGMPAAPDGRPPQAAPQVPPGGSLLDRLRQPEQAPVEPASYVQPVAATPVAAKPQPLSFEQLVATAPAPAPATPPPAPAKPQPLSFEQLVATAPAPAAPSPAPAAPAVAGRPSGNTELIQLSAAGARRKERERRLWMAALIVGVLMMLAGLGLGLLVLLAG